MPFSITRNLLGFFLPRYTLDSIGEIAFGHNIDSMHKVLPNSTNTPHTPERERERADSRESTSSSVFLYISMQDVEFAKAFDESQEQVLFRFLNPFWKVTMLIGILLNDSVQTISAVFIFRKDGQCCQGAEQLCKQGISVNFTMHLIDGY